MSSVCGLTGVARARSSLKASICSRNTRTLGRSQRAKAGIVVVEPDLAQAPGRALAKEKVVVAGIVDRGDLGIVAPG